MGVVGGRPASFQLLLFSLGISGIAAVWLMLSLAQGIRRTYRTPPLLYHTNHAYSVHVPAEKWVLGDSLSSDKLLS